VLEKHLLEPRLATTAREQAWRGSLRGDTSSSAHPVGRHVRAGGAAQGTDTSAVNGPGGAVPGEQSAGEGGFLHAMTRSLLQRVKGCICAGILRHLSRLQATNWWAGDREHMQVWADRYHNVRACKSMQSVGHELSQWRHVLLVVDGADAWLSRLAAVEARSCSLVSVAEARLQPYAARRPMNPYDEGDAPFRGGDSAPARGSGSSAGGVGGRGVEGRNDWVVGDASRHPVLVALRGLFLGNN